MPILAIALLAATADVTDKLRGIWETACLPIGKDGRHGVMTRIMMNSETMEATAQLYAARDCVAPTFQINFRGQIHFRGEAEKGAAGEQISFSYKVVAIDLTPQDQAVVDQYNRADGGRHGCGLPGWRLNIPQSVAGQECTPFHFARIGTLLHDNGWLDGDGNLRFGAFPILWSNDAESKRPDKPLPTAYHRVQR